MNEMYCERCGEPLSEGNGLDGCCARCLMEKGLESTSGFVGTSVTFDTLPQRERRAFTQPASIGRYRILRLIGEGGMGAVYEAEQEHPRRTVALKILKPGIATSGTLRRFELEAEALGRLQHPGIAQIYEAGTADTGFGPQPYFAMELILGRTPLDYVKEHNLAISERLELVRKTAEAVHHAHQRGLIHRDLKPSNILVDETGQPKVLDFGVARAIDNDGQATQQTDAGQLVGTLAYMSPEQVLADPAEIDIRSDLYALGTLLYELLAGRLPLNTRGKLPEVIQAIREEDPTPLGRLDRRYKGDIETIAIKALEKDKTQRYTSAAELAADIRRYLSDQPIVARPPSAGYQLKKFARRNRVLVAGVAAVLAVLILGVIVSSWQAARARRAEQAALLERDNARKAQALATSERNLAIKTRQQATAAEAAALAERNRAIAAEEAARREASIANTQRLIANKARQQATAAEAAALAERNRAIAAEEAARREVSIANTQRLISVWHSLVQESLRESARKADYDRAALLAVQAMRFNARIPNQPTQGLEAALQQSIVEGVPHILADNSTKFQAVAFSPDGALLAAGGADEMLRLWEMRNPGASPLAVRAAGRNTRGISSIAFSADGKRVAVGSVAPDDSNLDTIRVWDLQNLNVPPLVLEGGGSIESLAFAPDGIHLASAAMRYQDARSSKNPVGVIVWDLRNPKAVHVLSRNPLGSNVSTYGRVGFSQDSARLAVASAETVELWNLQNPGAEPLLLRPQPTAMSTPSFPIVQPDETEVLLRSQPTAMSTPLPFPFAVHSVAFSPDGEHLAISSSYGVQIWDLRNLHASPLAVRMPLSSGYPVRLLTYGSDGARLAGGTSMGVFIWDLRNPGSFPSSYSPTPNGGVNAAAYSSKGARVAAVAPGGLLVWDFASADRQPSISSGLQGSGLDQLRTISWTEIAYSGDLSRFADVTGENLRLWDPRKPDALPMTIGESPAGSAGPILVGGGRTYTSVTLCRDGTRVAAASNLGRGISLSTWDVRNPAQPQFLASLDIADVGPGQLSRPLGCSFDGTRVAVSGATIHVVDLQRPNAPLLSLGQSREVDTVSALSFSPDGSKLAIGRREHTVEVWDLRNPGVQPLIFRLREPTPFLASVMTLAFSSDGMRLAASASGVVEVWDLRHPEAPGVQFPGGPVAAFSPNGKELATSGNRVVRIWDLQNPAVPALDLPWPQSLANINIPNTLAFSPDGLRLSAGTWLGRVVVWRLGPAAADYLCSRVWRNLSREEWQLYIGEGIPYESTCPALPPGAGVASKVMTDSSRL